VKEDAMTHTGDGCMRCQTPMESLGVAGLRRKSTDGDWTSLVGDWSSLDGETLPLELLTCRNCGYVELRRPLPEPAGM
jgi:hypothetical protein